MQSDKEQQPFDSRIRSHVSVHLELNENSSVHNCGCVVNGSNAMAAICIEYYKNINNKNMSEILYNNVVQ